MTSNGSERKDIEQKQTENALRESEERYRAVVNQSVDGIFLVDVESKQILDANTALQRLLGYSADELSQLELYDIVAHGKEEVDRNIQHILAEGGRFLGERSYRCKDGTRMDVEVSVNLIAYGGREAMCVVARDITGRKKAEEEKDRLEKPLP